MDNLIVYLDDAAYAQHLLQPMLPESGSARTPTRWILVGCAPRVTRHASKFVTQGARHAWRDKWAQKAFAELTPMLQQEGDSVLTELAGPCLRSQTEALVRTHGAARVLDARRPRFGQDLQPVTATQARPGHANVLGYAAALASAGLLVATD